MLELPNLSPEDLRSMTEEQIAVLLWLARWKGTARDKQRPPPDPWSEWGLLAGRGFGKTMTGAQWLAQEAYFDPDAHPSAVIAPTLNDVRHTCFEGPAGLLNTLPLEIVEDYNKTNLIVTIRTLGGKKSIIRGFSSEEPERLRGPQFARMWCFVAGTQVLTPSGEKPIEKLKAGDFVQTRAGPRRVLANSCRNADVGVLALSHGRDLVGTADHPVYTLKYGWMRMDQLQQGWALCAVGAKNGAARSGTGTGTGTTSAQTSTNDLKPDAFTEKSGSQLSALFHRVLTYITGTKTRATTSSQTTFFWPRETTLGTTGLLQGPLLRRTGQAPLFSRWRAKTAKHRFGGKSSLPPCAVQSATNVERMPPEVKSRENADTAGRFSDPELGISAVSVASTWRHTGRQPVYCLKVEGEPEYFANGVLVHNCDELAAWARDEETWDMAMMGLRLGPHPKVVWTTTPKPKELIRKLAAPKAKRVITTGTTYENRAHLPDSFFEQLTQYEGTQLGRQELNGELIDAEEGGIIQRGWLRKWPHDRPLPKFDFIVMSLDTAFTEKVMDKRTQTADPSACSVWGVFWLEDKRNILLLDCWEEHLGLPDLIKKVKAELNTAYGDESDQALISPLYGPAKLTTTGRKPDILLIEEKGSGISLRQSLEREGIEAYAYNPGRADKTARLHAVSHIFARKMVWVPESAKYPGRFRTWAEPFVTQLCSFSGPGSIKHDDYVDTTSQAVRYIIDKGMVDAAKLTPQKSTRYDLDAPVAKPSRVNPYAV